MLSRFFMLCLLVISVVACSVGSGGNKPGRQSPSGPSVDECGNEVVDAAAPKVTVEEATVREGNQNNSQLVFVISSDKAVTEDVEVILNLEPGLATAGEDYLLPASNSVSILTGETSANFVIDVLGDTLLEPTETVKLTLKCINSGARLGKATQAWGFIINDEVWRGPLNDTGLDIGVTLVPDVKWNDDCSGTQMHQQDCAEGYDADPAENSNEDGRLGFKFTKLDDQGQALPADASSWSCVRDERTGLIWEVKTFAEEEAQKDIRDASWDYASYDPLYLDGDATGRKGLGDEDYRHYTWLHWGQDGIWAGSHDYPSESNEFATFRPGANDCGREDEVCTTFQYVFDINHGDGICGFKDWRVPSYWEADSIVDYRNYRLDSHYFPHHISFWTNTPSHNGSWNGETPPNGIPEKGLIGVRYFSIIEHERVWASHERYNLFQHTLIGNRLVRGGTGDDRKSETVQAKPATLQVCNASIISTTPVADFTFNPNGEIGTVKHIPTGLTWKRCPESFTYHDNDTPNNYADDRCDIADRTLYIADAWHDMAAGVAGMGGSWRLPNAKEVLSIQEASCKEPAYNTAVFPYIPPANLDNYLSNTGSWSSTPYRSRVSSPTLIGFFTLGFSGRLQSVLFDLAINTSGGHFYDAHKHDMFVRLVK